MQLKDIMTRKVSICDTRDNLEAVARIMWDQNFACVPIVNGTGKLVGIVTDRDVAMAAYAQRKRLSEIPVKEVMARRVLACEHGLSIAQALDFMHAAGIKRLPVIDNVGNLVGLVNERTVLSALERERLGVPASHANTVIEHREALNDHA